MLTWSFAGNQKGKHCLLMMVRELPHIAQKSSRVTFSPINLVEKGNTGKYRPIYGLSHPYDGETAVNDCIPPDDMIQMVL